MAFTEYVLVATSDPWSAADHNTYNRDNINELWPYTTLGDIAYSASGTELSRLGIGSEKKVLNVVGGIPAWAVGLPGLFTAQGDLVYATGANAMARLAKGADKRHLQMSGNVPAWVNAVPGIFTAEGDLVYATGSNAMARLARGKNEQVLSLASGLPAWMGTMLGGDATSVYGPQFTAGDEVEQIIQLDVENYDDGGWHDNVINNERITVTETGLYLAYAVFQVVQIGTDSNKTRRMIVRVNGSEGRGGRADTSADWTWWRSGWYFLNLTAGDYLTFYVWQNSGSTMTITPDEIVVVKIK